MQPKSSKPELFGMTIFQIGVLVGLGLILCVAVVLVIFMIYSRGNQQTPTPTAFIVQPTYTPYPTYTPPPAANPTTANILQPTLTSAPVTSSSFVTPLGSGVIKVNSWSLQIIEIRSDPGTDSTRQVIVLLANLTNEGTGTDTFVPRFKVVLRDSQGRLYEDDSVAGFAAQEKYQTEYSASISPGATEYISIAYDVPLSEKSFSLVAGNLVSNWSGDVSFVFP